MQKKINIALFCLIPALLLLFLGLKVIKDNEVKEYSSNVFYMDTYMNIKIYGTSEKKAKVALKEVEKIYRHFHQISNRYEAVSGVNNLYTIKHNTSDKEYLTIDRDLYRLIEYGVSWYELSDEKFNINMGNLVDVWKSYRDKKTGVPTEEELQSTGSMDIKDIVLKDGNKILNNHVNIDLGGLAKGYATEKAGEYLRTSGFERFLINAGGNVMAGDHYANSVYSIGVENPETGGVFKIVKGNNLSVVTSGGYERFYEYKGNKYNHILDPATKYPANNVLSVTIVTSDSGKADALSTTLFLMSVEDGQKYLEQFDDVEAIWYKTDGKIVTTPGMKEYE